MLKLNQKSWFLRMKKIVSQQKCGRDHGDLRHEMRIAHKDPKIVEEYKNTTKALNNRGIRNLFFPLK